MSDKDTLITDELYQRSIDDIPISADDYMAPEEDDSVSTDYLTDAVFFTGQDFGSYDSSTPYCQPAGSIPPSTGGYRTGDSRQNRSGARNSFQGNTDKGNNIAYLRVPFNEKDEAKKLGARWDASAKKWYVPAGVPLDGFAKWL